LAAVGSKLDGTGFEKLHIVQSHVAVVGTDGGGRETLSPWMGEEELSLVIAVVLEEAR
jgi:hypothetical protein